MTKFGEYVRSARERRGWTLREAARRTGLSHSRLFELETGISSKTGKPVVPSAANLKALAEGYGLPKDDLVALAHFPEMLKDRSGMEADELAVLDTYRSLTRARQRLWLQIGEGLKALPPERKPE